MLFLITNTKQWREGKTGPAGGLFTHYSGREGGVSGAARRLRSARLLRDALEPRPGGPPRPVPRKPQSRRGEPRPIEEAIVPKSLHASDIGFILARRFSSTRPVVATVNGLYKTHDCTMRVMILSRPIAVPDPNCASRA